MGNSSKKNKESKRKSKLTEKQLINKLKIDINKLVTDNEKLSEEKEYLFQLMELNNQATQFHLNKVKETTGSVEEEDVNYCLRLSKRIIDHYLNNN